MKLLQGWRLGAGLLLASLVGANGLNFVFNAYLGRELTPEQFGVLSLVSTLMYVVLIPINALQATANHQAAFYEARYGAEAAQRSDRRLKRATVIVGIAAAIACVPLVPALADYFRLDSPWPIALSVLVPLVGFTLAVYRGTLNGRLLFVALAIVTLAEPAFKLTAGLGLVFVGFPSLAYTAIPLSLVAALAVAWWVTRFAPAPKLEGRARARVPLLAWRFFFAVLLAGFSAQAFLSVDVLLAKHFLSPEAAGQYALVSLVGKMVFFLGTLSSDFIIPFVSRAEGHQQSTTRILRNILVFTAVCVVPGFLVFAVAPGFTVSLLFGPRGLAAVAGAPWIAAGTLCFVLAKLFVGYHVARRQYVFAIVASALVVVQVTLIALYHDTPAAIAKAMALAGAINLLVIVAVHLASPNTSAVGWNLSSLLKLFTLRAPAPQAPGTTLRVLILNWRDTRHKWAGGAEVYLHELACRLVKSGMRVTVFCGNDEYCASEEVIDGVNVIRRGGFYTVYAWAFLYYLLKFRKKFDVIVDCENGVPFFSPLFAKVPVVLVLFHVHQEVFVEHLRAPLARVATLLEGKLMPRIYKGRTVITISESSRADICISGIAEFNNVRIVHPGVNRALLSTNAPLSRQPQFAYLGRLKPYKNVDVAIYALEIVRQKIPNARLVIAGDGESREDLEELTRRLGLQGHVTFLGRVSELEKARVLAESWAAIQPSMLEGWGITVIEANACGTPVIASQVSGLRDTVVDGKTGRLVQPMNVAQFALEMIRIAERGDYRAALRRGAFAWAKNFDWDTSAALFGEILSERASQVARRRPVVAVPRLAPGSSASGVVIAGASSGGQLGR